MPSSIHLKGKLSALHGMTIIKSIAEKWKLLAVKISNASQFLKIDSILVGTTTNGRADHLSGKMFFSK